MNLRQATIAQKTLGQREVNQAAQPPSHPATQPAHSGSCLQGDFPQEPQKVEDQNVSAANGHTDLSHKV